MTEDEFVQNYISECIETGIFSLKDICEKASLEIKDIEKKLSEFSNLRIKEKNLKNVIRTLSVDKEEKKINYDFDDSQFSDNPVFKEMLTKICDLFKNGGTFSSREIMDAVGSLEENQMIYMSIKHLCDNGILSRDEISRKIIKGERWID